MFVRFFVLLLIKGLNLFMLRGPLTNFLVIYGVCFFAVILAMLCFIFEYDKKLLDCSSVCKIELYYVKNEMSLSTL